MASTSGVSAPIKDLNTVSGNQPRVQRLPEAATQTFLMGVPVQLDANGRVAEWDGATIARGIAGVSLEPANNLASAGVAQQQAIPGTSVPNEPNAKIFSRPYFNDGMLGFEEANDDTLFYGQVGTTTAATDKGKRYGMTKDTDGHWYIDKAKTTVGTNTVVIIIALDPNDTARGVWFRFDRSANQLS